QRRRFFGLVVFYVKQRAKLLKGTCSAFEHVEFHSLHVDLYEMAAWQSEGIDRDERDDFSLPRTGERNSAGVSWFGVIDRWDRDGAVLRPAALLCATTLSMALSARFPHKIWYAIRCGSKAMTLPPGWTNRASGTVKTPIFAPTSKTVIPGRASC